MKAKFLFVAALLIFLSSCEVEVRGGHRYYHPHGWGMHHHHDEGHDDHHDDHHEGR